MFRRLDKFDGLIFGGGGGAGVAYIRDVNWVTYLHMGVYSGGLYTRGVLTGFYYLIILLKVDFYLRAAYISLLDWCMYM